MSSDMDVSYSVMRTAYSVNAVRRTQYAVRDY
jgi:hypothetical protein